MKNFKKLVATILALSIVATSALTATAATVDFSDGHNVSHVEAVDVMTAIGVIHGLPDGSFNPDGDVTRAEMSKMVATILNKGEDISSGYASSNTFTDCGSWHWASGYIAYTATKNIIDGNGDGTFSPDGTVTGAQAAKMLLTTLGYSSANEGYTGANWVANVMNDAEDIGLSTDFPKGFDYDAPLSRQLAALMMFNALTATMVDYSSSGTSVTLPDGTVINNGNANIYDRTWANSSGVNYETGKDSVTGETKELCEHYFPDLYISSASSDAEDKLGRPSHTWYFEKEAVGTYATEADYTFFSEDEVTTAADFHEVIEDTIDVDLTYTISADVVYINGVTQDAFGADEAELQRGDIVEVYMDEDDSKAVSRVVITRYVYDTIKSVDVETKLSNSEITTDGGETLTEDDTMNFQALLNGAEEDAVILVAGSAAAEYPTAITGTITRYTIGESIIMDGTTYYINTDSYVNHDMGISEDGESTIYVSSTGFVVYAEEIDSDGDSDTVVTIKSYAALNADSEIVDMVKVVTANGSIQSWEVDKAYTAGHAYQFSEDTNVYTLTTATDLADLVDADGKGTSFDAMEVTSKTYSIPVNIGDSTETIYFADDVVFIFVDTDDDCEVTVYEGITAFDGSHSGYAVLEQINRNGTGRMDYRISAMYVIGDGAVADDAETSSDDIFFMDGGKTGTTKVDGDIYHTYDVYVNGELVEDVYASSANYTGGFYTAKVDSVGAYTFTSFTGDSDYTTQTAKFATNIDNRFLVVEGDTNDYDVTNAKVVDTTNGDYSKLKDLDTNANLTFIYDEDFVVNAIYVID